ncbi:MAG TPA: DUF4203 domain-containing protein [Candidatus Pelethocola excrementipullorum]|nr:DUF4203 domain-containing protein [Candidatus Pelethocola excrementipullorum]
MNELSTVYTLLDKLGLLDEFYHTYGPYILKAALAFALLNCFFGYKLRKVWSCIFGLLLGVGAGLAAAVYLNQPANVALIAAAVGGILCTALAFLLYRIGMFFLCIGVVIMTLFQLFPTPTFSTICGFVVFGVVMGFLAVIKEHNVVICVTAICGGIGSARLIMLLTSNTNSILMILLAVFLSALGLFLQFKPWKEKEYWEKEEEKNQKKRDSRKSGRSSHKSKAKKSKSKSSSGKKKSSSRSSGSRNASSNRTTYESETRGGRNTRTSDGQPYNRRADSAPNNDPLKNSRPSSGNPNSARPNNARPNSARPNSTRPNTNESKGSAGTSDPYTVDLSDIRTEISKEIQDIYQENHK